MVLALAATLAGSPGAAQNPSASEPVAATSRSAVPILQPRPSPDDGASRPSAASAPPADARTVGPPSACFQDLVRIARVKPVPPISDDRGCSADDLVELQAALTPSGQQIALTPPATLRCSMARAVTDWIRDEAVQLAAELGALLASIVTSTSFECRGRNRVEGAKPSEHGKANALDVSGFSLADGTVVALTDSRVAKDVREALKTSLCQRFSTVLGPGSDSAHENHVHIDLIDRRSGYRICQWDVRDASDVPLPRERPSSAPPRAQTGLPPAQATEATRRVKAAGQLRRKDMRRIRPSRLTN